MWNNRIMFHILCFLILWSVSLSSFLPGYYSNDIFRQKTLAQNFIQNNRLPPRTYGNYRIPAKKVHKQSKYYSSPNDVISDPSLDPSLATDWDSPLDQDICIKLKSLTRSQLQICQKYTNITAVAAIGITQAVSECRRKFKSQRWNCTSLTPYLSNPHASPLMVKGFSESAFVHAIAAAGITHSVARACAAGRLNECSCGQVRGKRAWKWTGCHDNTRFGAKFSRKFLDARERDRDVLSFTHLFNNEVGRKLVRRNRDVQCKCHGMSGSCEMKTCWKAAPDFKKVGNELYNKYLDSQSATHTVFGNSPAHFNFKTVRRKISSKSPLLYAERSPSFCESDYRLGFYGTYGRQCNITSTGQDSCQTLCCGRGYTIKRRKIKKKCNCRFKWCCEVTCQDCIYDEWVSVCK